MSARVILAAAFVVGLVAGCSLPPQYTGRYWCFIADDAYGRSEDGQVSAIHSSGGPFRACFCFCDDLHADTILFTGEPDPPQPSEAWLEIMSTMRGVAVEACEDRGAELGLVENNCAEALPVLPTLLNEERVCYGEPQREGTYCTEPDPDKADGETGETGAGVLDRQ